MDINYADLFLVVALFFVACHVVITILILHELGKRKIPTNFLLVRLLIFRYVKQYRDVTKRETGSPGPLFYLYIISINLAAVLAIIGAILKRF